MLGNSTLEIQKKLKAGGKWADEDAIQAAADFLKQEIWVVNVGNGYNHTGQVVRFMPAVQDMQIKPMVLRLLNNHFEAIRVNSIWLEERAVSWEAYKRSPFDIYAHYSEMAAQDARTGSDLRGGGRGGGKGQNRAQFADIPGVTYDISGYLSFVLRHGAIKEGITMDNEGYVKVEDILARKPHASIDSVLQAVNKCEKGRFELLQGEDGWLIRATQHNKELDLSNDMHRRITLLEEVDQATLFHGTYLAAWGSIRRQGLRCGHRQHVHFSTTYFVNHGQSGMRPGCDLVGAENVDTLTLLWHIYFGSAPTGPTFVVNGKKVGSLGLSGAPARNTFLCFAKISPLDFIQAKRGTIQKQAVDLLGKWEARHRDLRTIDCNTQLDHAPVHVDRASEQQAHAENIYLLNSPFQSHLVFLRGQFLTINPELMAVKANLWYWGGCIEDFHLLRGMLDWCIFDNSKAEALPRRHTWIEALLLFIFIAGDKAPFLRKIKTAREAQWKIRMCVWVFLKCKVFQLMLKLSRTCWSCVNRGRRCPLGFVFPGTTASILDSRFWLT